MQSCATACGGHSSCLPSLSHDAIIKGAVDCPCTCDWHAMIQVMPAAPIIICLTGSLLTWVSHIPVAVSRSAGLQAESLGSQFRNIMYPRYGPAGGGLLRLHSTYRHDLKIYSSDEGRVQSSAAAFTQVTGLS